MIFKVLVYFAWGMDVPRCTCQMTPFSRSPSPSTTRVLGTEGRFGSKGLYFLTPVATHVNILEYNDVIHKMKISVLTYVVTVRSNLIPHTPALRTVSVLREIDGHILTSSVRQFKSNLISCVENRKHAESMAHRADSSFPVFSKTAHSLRGNMFCFQFQHRRALVSKDSSRPSIHHKPSLLQPFPSSIPRGTRLE